MNEDHHGAVDKPSLQQFCKYTAIALYCVEIVESWHKYYQVLWHAGKLTGWQTRYVH